MFSVLGRLAATGSTPGRMSLAPLRGERSLGSSRGQFGPCAYQKLHPALIERDFGVVEYVRVGKGG